MATSLAMTLEDYLQLPGALSASALASAVGCNKSYITRLRKNQRQPSLTVASKIERATGGKVKMAAMLQERPAPAIEERAA